MGSMYQVNPLIDLQEQITPAQIMYRLENIHAALQGKSITGQLSIEKIPSPTKKQSDTPKKTEIKPESPKKVVAKNKHLELTPETVLKDLCDRISQLKEIKNQLDQTESGLIDDFVAPYGQLLRLKNAFNAKIWFSDRNQLKTVAGIKKSTGNKLRLVLSVPSTSSSCSWFPLALELLRSRQGKCYVTQHVHSSVRQNAIHDRPILSQCDALNETESDVLLRVLIKDNSSIALPELIVDGWPNRHVFVGNSAAIAFGVLAGAFPSNSADVSRQICELSQLFADCRCLNELQVIANKTTKLLMKPSSSGNKPEYLTGASATILDIILVTSIINSPFYSKFKLSPALTALINKIVEHC